MPLETRIRRGLDRDAHAFEPASDAALRTVLERGPRRRAARTVGRGVALVAVVSVFVFGGFAAIRATDDGGQAGDAPSAAVSPLDGGWRVTLSIEDGLAADLGYGRARRLAGPRQLELSLGVVRQVRPGSFETIPMHGTFRIEGPFLIIDDQGETLILRWTLSGDELRFALVDDSRPAAGERVDRFIWTTHAWQRVR